MAELTAFTVDTDDEFLLPCEESRLQDEDHDTTLRSPRPRNTSGCLSRLCGGTLTAPAPLSVQSGDITRHPPPNLVDHEKSRLYEFTFNVIHPVVKVVGFQIGTVPVFSLFLVLFAIAYAFAFGIYAVLAYPVAINFSVRSFQVPDDPISEHYDAFRAAVEGSFATSGPSKGTRSLDTSWGEAKVEGSQNHLFVKGQVHKGVDHTWDIDGRETLTATMTKGLSTSHFSGCKNNSLTQHYFVESWVMDIVFKSKRGTNVLSKEQIRYIHDIEEHIYHHHLYRYFCHIGRSLTVCDPVSSLLTYLYPRNYDGSYKYPPEGLVSNYESYLNYLVNNVPATLYYTGGQVGTNLTATLLRSQIQVGVPLPCYANYEDRTHEQEKMVLQFFLEIADYLDHASTK